MNLFEATKQLWTAERSALADRWADELEAGLPRILEASRLFNEPRGLRFYVTLGEVAKAGRIPGGAVRFSVRHRGQEVAKLSVGSDPALVVSEKHETTNRDYLRVSTPAVRSAWTGREARAFRKHFQSSAPGARLKSVEHEYESRILEQLEGRSAKSKFRGTLAGVRHCGLTKHEYPVQFPVPISANRGTPVGTRGNIDILVRHQRGGRTRLSVWELKKPGTFQHALSQAYIYAVTLVLMARGRTRDKDWYQLLKFSRGVPDRIEVEAVAVVTADQQRKLASALEELAESPRELPGLNARVSLHAVIYDPETLEMSWLDLEPQHAPGVPPTRLRG